MLFLSLEVNVEQRIILKATDYVKKNNVFFNYDSSRYPEEFQLTEDEKIDIKVFNKIFQDIWVKRNGLLLITLMMALCGAIVFLRLTGLPRDIAGITIILSVLLMFYFRYDNDKIELICWINQKWYHKKAKLLYYAYNADYAMNSFGTKYKACLSAKSKH